MLDHPDRDAGVAGRYATHPDPAIRLRVATHPQLITSTLGMLVGESDSAVQAAAIAALTQRASG